MRNKMIGVIVIVVCALIGMVYLSWTTSVMNNEVRLSKRYEAQQNVVETSIFKMRSVIKNILNCKDDYADNFIAVVAEQSKGRQTMSDEYSNSVGGLSGVNVNARVNNESASLGIPTEMYMKVSNAIEGQVGEFVASQELLTDVWREHITFCELRQHNWFGLNMRSKIKPMPKMITSKETKSAVDTGEMD